MSEQLSWDRFLIEGWRKDYKLAWAVHRWQEENNKPIDMDSLLRTPRKNFPLNIRIRIFIANFLPKINDRLWDQPVERDEPLIAKLQTTKYDTLNTVIKTEEDRERARENNHKYREMRTYTTLKMSERNAATDWNTVKGGKTRRIR